MFIEKAKTGENHWWQYVLTLLIVFVAIQLGSIPLGAYLVLRNPEAAMQGNLSLATDTNAGLALALLGFVVGFFALLFCAKWIHKKNILDIITARPKFDWKRFFYGAALWGILGIVSIVITVWGDTEGSIVFQFDAPKFIVLVLIALIFLPFQTAFEEIAFRGYLMQGSALLFRSKWVALILTSLLFGLMHITNPEVKEFGIDVALPQYILMGFFLGYVALKDNGLELSIGIHAANNIISALTFTSDASALQTHALLKDLHPTASHWDTLIMLVSILIFVGLINRKYRFVGKDIFSLK